MSQTVLAFIRANRRYLAELLLGSLLINGFMLALPLFSNLVYDKAMGNELHDTLWALTAGMCLLLGLEFCLRVARVLLVEHAGARWDARLDERLVAGILAAPMSRPLRVGDVLGRYRELSSSRDFLSAQFLLPLADLPFVFLFAIAIFLTGGVLVAIPFCVGAFTLALSAALNALSHTRQKRANVSHGLKVNRLVDMLLARESLADSGASRLARQHFKQPSGECSRASAQARLWGQLSQQVWPIALTASSVAMLVAGVYMVEARALSVGGLIACSMLSGRIVGTLGSLVSISSRWKEFSRALRGLGVLVDLDVPPEMPMPASGKSAFDSESMRLEKVGFAYPGTERKVLDGLDVILRTGELVAVVGASGSGKTSFLRLLAGQIAHSEGRVSYAGHVIEGDMHRRWLSHQVSYKSQEPCFLEGTITEIVAPGEDAPDDARISSALRCAGLGPALDRAELGLSRKVGTNGAGLSGGQRQMLAIARVMYAPRSLVVLDEPTLGLDRTAQDALLEALKALKSSRCVVVATHTTELIQCADRVLVLDHGRLVADSTPAKLFGSSRGELRVA